MAVICGRYIVASLVSGPQDVYPESWKKFKRDCHLTNYGYSDLLPYIKIEVISFPITHFHDSWNES